jgi:hypothetical protein
MSATSKALRSDNLCQTQANNKERTIVHFSCQDRKERKKLKQSITDNNPTMICLHVLLHMKEGMTAHLVIRQMGRFGHQEMSHAPPTRWDVRDTL